MKKSPLGQIPKTDDASLATGHDLLAVGTECGGGDRVAMTQAPRWADLLVEHHVPKASGPVLAGQEQDVSAGGEDSLADGYIE